MARRAWVISGVGLATIALAAATSPSVETAARSQSTSVSTAVDSNPPITAEPPQTSTSSAPTTVVTIPPTTASTSTIAATTTSTTSSTTSTTTTTIPPDRPFDGASFDAVVSAATVGQGDISAGVAVLRNGTVLHTAAFGMENPLESVPATVDTRFRIASVSKMFTAVAIMQLVNEGAIDLDAPFAAQLDLDGPFNDPRIASVTVRQLMSHTSGFTAARGIFFGHGVDTWQQAAKDALGQILQFDPGTAFQYSNTNYCVLGMLLEAVTGEKFETAIRKRVLRPIGITARLAPTFDTERGDALHTSSPGRNYMETLGPAGGWVTTPLDIAKLAASLRPGSDGPHLLDEGTVDAMRVPVSVPVETPLPNNGWSYGLGLILFGDGSWGHTGTIESTHAMVENRPDGLTVAVLVSGTVPSDTDDLQAVIDLAVTTAFE